jgi:hypothetical protein
VPKPRPRSLCLGEYMSNKFQVKKWKSKNPFRRLVQRQSEQMRYVIKTLGGIPPKNVAQGCLYDLLVDIVLKDEVTAKKKFPFGIPDAKNSKVEYKIGFDRLHRSQFIWNILNGHNCKIRWFPTYDDLEESLLGHSSNGKLFDSYKDFILWQYEQGIKERTVSAHA